MQRHLWVFMLPHSTANVSYLDVTTTHKMVYKLNHISMTLNNIS